MNEQSTKPAATQPAVSHATFAVERAYPVPPERVFFAFSDLDSKRRWFAEGEGWEVIEFTSDFSVGGSEFSRFRFGDGPEMTNDTQYQNIVPNERIVISYRMAVGGAPISVSLATIEFSPSGKGTVMTYTEQGVYFDDASAGANREIGCRELMEALARELDVAA
ncbi:SRPBCC family protein [Rhizobium sp. Pop5]|uniref:SRPBCC family protein n=2 Tax=Rhizobium sp. Pop5 TaxID=1223565 RepID=UPI00215866B3|nr:SRPBCC family protein [Rhizobium sp. Pop5]UVD55974.1 SRPBCC family protein [Rhizobium sp. Pop5]